jgi:hypothetical protein
MQSLSRRLLKIEQAIPAYLSRTIQSLPDPEILKADFRKFIEYFFPLVYGRPFLDRRAFGRESYSDVIISTLNGVVSHDPTYKRTYIGSPPRYGKTTYMVFFVAWSIARTPQSNFIYASYAKDLSVIQTRLIKTIISLPQFYDLFGIRIRRDFSAAEHFATNTGAEVFGAGNEGGITGKGAGIPNSSEFGGCIIIDDIHKPMEVTSDTYRAKIIEWYKSTLVNRVNNEPTTPIIMIAHRLHEDDLPANLLQDRKLDRNIWTPVILPALNESNIALMPDMHTSEVLQEMQSVDQYNFASQYQQNPIPAGGALFKTKNFEPLLDEIPDNIVATFITVDTAETKETYNDATVFSFWGLYKIKIGFQETNLYGLHWIDCHEMRVEPRQLHGKFLEFWSDCLRFPIKPQFAAIEKKSTGVTLLSVLEETRGLEIIEIERTANSGPKASRYISMQKFIASKRITLHKNCSHASICIEHMSKITANDSHRHDDIADTCYDAIKLAFIDNKLESLLPQQESITYGFNAPPQQGMKSWNSK